MTELKRNLPLTEIEQFNSKFPKGKQWQYKINFDSQGKIILIESDNKEILEYCKGLGLVE